MMERRPAQVADTMPGTARPTRQERAQMVAAFEAEAVRNRARIARELADRPRIEAERRALRARVNRRRVTLAEARRTVAKLRDR